MATVQKNMCVSGPAEGKRGAAVSPAAEDAILHPADLQQAYSALQERFQRTTNALGSAAHDLKTPLAILNGYVELLQSEKLGSLNARQREVLGDMQSSGKRLQQFIQDFLTYSALETGGLKMQFAPGNINECLSDVCRLWSTRFQEKGLALYFLANDKLPVFPFDSPKLERMISNLLENSFKFTPQGGTVWLHAEPYMWERRSTAEPAASGERRRQDNSQPNSVKVSVSDTGPGIPAEFHQEVFDDFFRLPGNEGQEGMGLGLAIVRRLAQGMGGKIWVESDPGAGCKFSFLIPFKPSPNPAGKGKNR
jgi:signal transduction histidine kinase